MKGNTYSAVTQRDPSALLGAENGDNAQNTPVELANAAAGDFSADRELFDDTPLPKSPTMALDKTLDEIRRYLRLCAAKMTQPESSMMFSHRQIIVNEWHQFALVLDRLLFIAFLFITLVTTFAMYH